MVITSVELSSGTYPKGSQARVRSVKNKGQQMKEDVTGWPIRKQQYTQDKQENLDIAYVRAKQGRNNT